MSKSKSNAKTILVRGAVILGSLAIILIVAVLAVDWIYSSSVEERIAAIRAEGRPTSIADLTGGSVETSENARAILAQKQKAIAAVTKALQPIFKKDPTTGSSLTERERQFLAAVLGADHGLMETFRRAAEAEHYQLNAKALSDPKAFTQKQIEWTGTLKSIARLIRLKVMLLNARGDHEAALETCLTLLALSRRFDQGPGLNAQLTAFACRYMAIAAANATLRHEGISQQMHDKLAAELARHDIATAFQKSLVSERAIGLSKFNGIVNKTGFWLAQLWWMDGQLDYLKTVERHIGLADQPYYEVVQSVGPPSQDIGVLTRQMIPSLRRGHLAAASTIARLRCLRILNALIAQQGLDASESTSLGKLDLPETVTTDPFSGESLLLEKTEQGWVVYSVGSNGKDDGGDLAGGTDIGLGPPVSADRSGQS